MQRVPSRKSALKPCPQQSLFKFMLHFHEHTEEYTRKGGNPWIWYSFDMPDERDMFAPGLPPDLRKLHTELLRRTFRYQSLHAFLSECYPVWRERREADPILTLYLPKHLLPQVAAISTEYSEPLHAILYQLGIIDWNVHYADNSRTIPGLSPAKLPNHDFYGVKCFEQNPQISYWFSAKMLKVARVFDHRCYHSNNLIGTIGQDEYPAPTGVLMPPPRVLSPGQHTNGRLNQPVPVGSLLKGVLHPAPAPAA